MTSAVRVLVVDDDPGVRDLFTRALVRAGFAVRAADGGQDALKLVREELPQLIVLDLMMPWMNGIEVLVAIRQHPQAAPLPVLVTTATATSAYDLRAYNPVRVLRKPFELARLVRVAGEMVGDTTLNE
jgi:CheY-like chemotaxis protein